MLFSINNFINSPHFFSSRAVYLFIFLFGLGLFTSNVETAHAIAEPTNQRHTCDFGARQVTFRWDSVSGAELYATRLQEVGGTEQTKDVTTLYTTYAISEETDYDWWMHAVGGGEWSTNTVHRFSCPKPPTPTNLKASCNTAGDWATLSWNHVSGNEGYNYHFNGTIYNHANYNTIDVPVTPGASNSWRAQTKSNGAWSYVSSEQYFTCDPPPPPPPTGLSSSCNAAGDRATLSWNHVSGNEGYNVNLNGRNFHASNNSIQLSVTPGNSNSWRVQTKDSPNWSTATSWQYFTCAGPAPPSCTISASPDQVVNDGGNGTTVSWNISNAVDGTLHVYEKSGNHTVYNNVGTGSGSRTFQVAQDSTFHLDVWNSSGDESDCETQVEVLFPECISLTASPSSFPVEGGSYTLQWTLKDAHLRTANESPTNFILPILYEWDYEYNGSVDRKIIGSISDGGSRTDTLGEEETKEDLYATDLSDLWVIEMQTYTQDSSFSGDTCFLAVETAVSACSDGIDNDGDGRTDGADWACVLGDLEERLTTELSSVFSYPTWSSTGGYVSSNAADQYCQSIGYVGSQTNTPQNRAGDNINACWLDDVGSCAKCDEEPWSSSTCYINQSIQCYDIVGEYQRRIHTPPYTTAEPESIFNLKAYNDNSPAAGSSFPAGTNITFEGMIANWSGDHQPGPVWADLQIDEGRDGPPYDSYNAYYGTQIDNLQPANGDLSTTGATEPLTYTTTLAAGDYRYRFFVDTTNSQREMDATDNTSPWINFTVTTAPPAAACGDGTDNDRDGLTDMSDPGCTGSGDDNEQGPVDLVGVSSGPAANASFDQYQSILFTGEVQNIGTDYLVADIYADIEVDIDSDGYVPGYDRNYNAAGGGTVSNLAPGGSAALSVSPSDLPPGTHRWRVNVDTNDLVSEPNESNNRSSWRTFTVNAVPECSNGLDDDGDGLTDWDGAGDPALADPGCDDANDNNEKNPAPGISIGTDDADGIVARGDTATIWWDANGWDNATTDCSLSPNPTPYASGDLAQGESAVTVNSDTTYTYTCVDSADVYIESQRSADVTLTLSECSNGQDDDDDGLTDWDGAGDPALADPGCTSADDTAEGDAAVSIYTDSFIVRRGGTVDIIWELNGNDPASCSLTGPDVGGPGVDVYAPSSDGSVTVSVQNQSLYTVTCGSETNETYVHVLPSIFEI